MDKFSSLINDEKFSKLSLKVADYPKSLVHWENLLNHLITTATPINKNIDTRLYSLIKATYESLLVHFPYVENYHIDYALFEFKLGNISKVHKIFNNALLQFNQRSLVIWIEYLKLCNELVMDNKQLFQKYETAERYIGLHFFSGEFWELYLQQANERCTSPNKYHIILRKVLEIPLHSFSKFYAIWLRAIDDIKDLSQVSLFVPKEDLQKKLKIDVSYSGRRGPYLTDAVKKLKKFTKELYLVVQYQVLDIYSLFESKIFIRYYTSPDTLIPSDEIEIWMKYLDYTINLRISSLTELNFQRALLPLAHYEIIWIKYAHWLIDWHDDINGAKNLLLKGLTMSHKKFGILKLLYSVLTKLHEYDSLTQILKEIESSYPEKIENTNDFEMFWDFIQFQTFCSTSTVHSRYSDTQSTAILPPQMFEKIMNRLSHGEARDGQEIILSYLVQSQSKETTHLIEDTVFKHIIKSDWNYYLNNGQFWALYCRLIFFDTSKSYLEKRRYIVLNIWKKACKNGDQVLPQLQGFCQAYLPEDIDTLYDLFGA